MYQARKKIYDIFDEINENDIWSLNKICADKQCGNSQRREFLGGCYKVPRFESREQNQGHTPHNPPALDLRGLLQLRE